MTKTEADEHERRLLEELEALKRDFEKKAHPIVMQLLQLHANRPGHAAIVILGSDKERIAEALMHSAEKRKRLYS